MLNIWVDPYSLPDPLINFKHKLYVAREGVNYSNEVEKSNLLSAGIKCSDRRMGVQLICLLPAPNQPTNHPTNQKTDMRVHREFF